MSEKFVCENCGKEYKQESSFMKHVCKDMDVIKYQRKQLTNPSSKKTTKTIPVNAITCKFCSKVLSEDKFINHSCTQRDRMMALKNDISAQRALNLYASFISNYYKNSASANDPERFAKSPLYDAFVKLSNFIYDTKMIHSDQYIRFLVSNKIPEKNWHLDETYSEFIKNVLISEPLDSAMNRTLTTAKEWCEVYKHELSGYFKTAPSSTIIYHIKTGRISPWIYYNAASAITRISEMDLHEIQIINNFAPASTWNLKFDSNLHSLLLVKSFLDEQGWNDE